MAEALVPGADPIPGLSAADAVGVIPPIKPTPPAQLQAAPVAPPPGASIKLSDGSYLAIPENAQPADVVKAQQQAESIIDADYMKHAASINGPFATTDKVYSATRAYPNNVIGRSMAWLDHNAGGNWMNQAVADPLNRATGDAGPAAMRIGTGAFTWAPDLAASVYNVGKHYVAPGMGTSYDAPVLGQQIRQAIGAPELSADAPFWQAALEAGLTGRAATGSGLVRNLVLGTTGTAGAEFGGEVGGEGGSLLGGIIAGGGIPARRLLTQGIAGLYAHPNAPDLQTRWERSKPPGAPDYPSFRELANPPGQRLAAAVAADPIIGARIIEGANEKTRDTIRAMQQGLAEERAGPGGIPPEGASTSSIGQEMIGGAQEAIPRVLQYRSSLWDPLNAAARGQSADIGNILTGMRQAWGAAPSTPDIQDVIGRSLGQLTAYLPGGRNFVGPVDPNAPPSTTVPFSVLKDWRTGLKAKMGQDMPELPEHWLGQLKDLGTEAMRNAYENIQPGLGQQFDIARASYAKLKPVLDRLYQIGGQPRGSGEFTAPPGGEAGAAGQLTQNVQNPSILSIFSNPNYFSPAHWGRAVGQFITTLGSQKGSLDYRPEHVAEALANKKISPDAWLEMLQGPQGSPLLGLQTLQDVRELGQNYSTPPARHGLIGAIGAGALVHHALKVLGGIGGSMVGGPLGAMAGVALPAAAVYGAAKGLESNALKRAMTGQPSQRAGFGQTLPVTSAITTQEEERRSPFLVPGTEAGIRQLYGAPAP